MSEDRPSTKMSEEEHSTLSTLTRSVSELAGSVRVLSDNQGRLEKVVTKLADGRQLSIGNLAIFVSMGATLAAIVVALLAMFFRSTIATDVTPKLDEMKRRYVARNTAQDIYLNLLWREQHGTDLPPYPPSE